MAWRYNLPKCPVSPADRGEYMKPSAQEQRCPICDWPMASSAEKGCVPGDCSYRPDDPAEQRRISERRKALSSVSTPAQDKFKRTYAVEIEFDTPFDFAEQDRLACVVLEKLVDEYWSDAAAGTQQGNMPIKVIAYPIPDQGR